MENYVILHNSAYAAYHKQTQVARLMQQNAIIKYLRSIIIRFREAHTLPLSDPDSDISNHPAPYFGPNIPWQVYPALFSGVGRRIKQSDAKSLKDQGSCLVLDLRHQQVHHLCLIRS